MIIDTRTGAVHLHNGIVITPALTKQQFQASDLGQASRPHITNGPWMSYILPSGFMDERKIYALVQFYEERLQEVIFSFNLADASPSNRSYEREMEVKAFHERLLRSDIGEPSRLKTWRHIANPVWELPWGEVASIYSQIDEFSRIEVKYMKKP